MFQLFVPLYVRLGDRTGRYMTDPLWPPSRSNGAARAACSKSGSLLLATEAFSLDDSDLCCVCVCVFAGLLIVGRGDPRGLARAMRKAWQNWSLH